MNHADAVTICECFARDGLQHEPDFIATEVKRELIMRFAALGFKRIEATSYSNPKVVPQFADASDLLKTLRRAARGCITRPPAPTCARWSGRLPTSEAGYGVNENQPAGLGQRGAHPEEPQTHA